MAVNEGLYNWMLKTYGMPAAEWYRSNPGSKPGANPFLPKGAYVPLADVGSDDTYASVSPEFEEVSVVEPASSAPDYFQQLLNSLSPEEQKEIQDFGLTDEEKKDAGYRYAASQQLGINDSPFASYEKNSFGTYEIPTNDPLVTYDPYYGKYGGYSTRENLGFRPSGVLYDRYKEWLKNNPVPIEESMVARAIRNDPTLGGTAGYSPEYADGLYRLSLTDEHRRQLAEYDAAEAARKKAFEDLYETPLSQIKYQNYSDAPSLDAFREQFKALGIEIPLIDGDYRYSVRSATEEDPEVQQFGIYNVGRSDYRNTRQREAIDKNIEILKQQAEQGIEGSQQFLNDYVASGGEGSDKIASILPPAMSQAELYREIQTRGNAAPGTKEYGELRDLQKEWIRRQIKGVEAPEAPKGPRGEVLTAQNKPTEPLRGQRTDVYYDKQMKQFVPRVDPGRVINDLLKQAGSTPEPIDVRVARASQQSDEQRERLTQQSEFDMSKEKQLASARAADTYRRSAANEDPFRAAARMG